MALLADIIKATDNKMVKVAQGKARACKKREVQASKLRAKVNKIMRSKANPFVKHDKLLRMLMELVNGGNSYNEADYQMLVEARDSLRKA